MDQMKGLARLFCHVERVKENWGWFLTLGILLVLFGSFAVAYSCVTTLFSVVLFGAVLLATGVVQIVQAFMARQWSGIFVPILVGLLYSIAGIACLVNPTMSALTLTVIFAVLCFIGGLFKMIASAVMQFESWGWVFFNGVVTMILGLLIYSEWPMSGLIVIGLFVGIDMILSGWSWILLSLAAKRA